MQDLILSPESEEPAFAGRLAAASHPALHPGRGNKHLSLEERLGLEAALRAGETQAAVAARLGRSPGAISMELKLNGGRTGYRAYAAHRAALSRRGTARRGDSAIADHPRLRDAIHAQLRRGRSPEEIARGLKADYPDDVRMHTSHESIYRYVYGVVRGELKAELASCLREHRPQRKIRRRNDSSQ